MARLRNILEGHPLGIHSGSTTNQLKDAMITKAYTSCDDFIEKEFTTFSRMCIREGWNVHKHLINIDDWRADWKYVPPPEKVEVTAKRLEGVIYFMLSQSNTLTVIS